MSGSFYHVWTEIQIQISKASLTISNWKLWTSDIFNYRLCIETDISKIMEAILRQLCNCLGLDFRIQIHKSYY